MGEGAGRGAAELHAVAARFAVPGAVAAVGPLGRGHINETYVVTAGGEPRPLRFVLQRINPRVFPRPAAVMANLVRVLDHLRRTHAARAERDLERRVLRLIPARDGAMAWDDGSGGLWRMFAFVEGAHTAAADSSPATVRSVAAAYGAFLRALADLPVAALAETIPGFHDTGARVAALAAAAASDPRGRAADARDTIEALLARVRLADRLAAPAGPGTLPLRVVHNDTKLDNVLLDDATGEALCVIDLDTVMPGLAVTDFGDLVRSAVTGRAEDGREGGRTGIDLRRFRALVRGYLDGAGDVLRAAEIGAFVAASLVITYECAVRFLTDHLQGDVYFRVQRPGHNLERARAQLALLESLEARADELEAVVSAERDRAPRSPGRTPPPAQR